MKKIIPLFTFLLLIAVAAPAQNCTNPVSAAVYQAGFNQVAIQHTDQQKLDKSLAFINDKCLMSAQVKNLALLFAQDAYRLEFCKAAYAHTFDQANFYDVYDAFAAFSYAFRLHDFITGTTTVTVQAPDPAPPAQTEPVFPNYAYPGVAGYNGKKGCDGPVINDDLFKTIAQNAFNQPTDESKYVAIQNASGQYCMSFAQVMKLVSLMQSEDMRLRTLINTFPRVFDQEHYQSGIVLFSKTELQNQWVASAQSYLTPPPPVCTVSDNDFNSIMNSIRAKNFPDDKMGVVSLLAKDRCFNVAQIRTISKEFPFDDDKLKVFKTLYARCPEQNNYYQLVDELTFSSAKKNLTDFIKNNGK